MALVNMRSALHTYFSWGLLVVVVLGILVVVTGNCREGALSCLSRLIVYQLFGWTLNNGHSFTQSLIYFLPNGELIAGATLLVNTCLPVTLR